MGTETNKTETQALKPKDSYAVHLTASFMATLGGHLNRVMMNLAAYHTDPFKVLKELPLHWHKGLAWNLLRGTSVVGSQSYLKTQASEYMGANTLQGKIAGLTAAAFAGTIYASIFETPFIRAPLRATAKTTLPVMRFSMPLSVLYFCREAGFSTVSLGAKDFDGFTYGTLYGCAIVITAACHKFATLEATTDIMEKAGIKTPNFRRDGFWRSLVILAKNQTYTHPACRGPIISPQNRAELAKNLTTIAAHGTMLFYRAFFLGVFALALDKSFELSRSLYQNQSGFFTRSKKEMTAAEDNTHTISNQPRK